MNTSSWCASLLVVMLLAGCASVPQQPQNSPQLNHTFMSYPLI
ncbi:hypothetical protein [Acinetobacter sp. CAAS 2-6]|nr:hypothetical protein [Acinetobacter sp. CAAS 2-6]